MRVGDKHAFEDVAKYIAGEIALASNPGLAIKKWRELFGVSQREMAKKLNISSSVISDYETGRRKSPGTKFVKQIVSKLMEIDMERGGEVLKSLASTLSISRKDFVIDMRDLESPIPANEFCKIINAVPVANRHLLGNVNIYGYTLINSIKAITYLEPHEMLSFYGKRIDRALIFTHVNTGKSMMVALRLTNLKPALAVAHGTKRFCKFSEYLARLEDYPIVISRIEKIEDLVDRLRCLE